MSTNSITSIFANRARRAVTERRRNINVEIHQDAPIPNDDERRRIELELIADYPDWIVSVIGGYHLVSDGVRNYELQINMRKRN
jgi:hypothetical protein